MSGPERTPMAEDMATILKGTIKVLEIYEAIVKHVAYSPQMIINQMDLEDFEEKISSRDVQFKEPIFKKGE
jgi:hypothetical protein